MLCPSWGISGAPGASAAAEASSQRGPAPGEVRTYGWGAGSLKGWTQRAPVEMRSKDIDIDRDTYKYVYLYI